MKLQRLLLFFICITLALSLPGCNKEPGGSQPSGVSSSEPEPAPEPPAEFPVTVGDTTILSRPGKVVSLSPALTEKIFDLGLENRLAGVSDFCDYPSMAGGYQKCGTAHMPDVETIAKLRAHLVVSTIPLPEEDKQILLKNGVDVVVIPPAESLMELYDAYIALARMFEGEYAGRYMGETFVEAVSGWIDIVRSECYAQEAAPKPALYLRNMPFTIATGDTLENDLMASIGLANIAVDLTGYEYPEDLATGEGRKDFESLRVMFFDQPTVSMKDHLEKSAFYKGLKATLNDWFLDIDYMIVERQSMRTFAQLREMAEYAWPDAEFPEWPPQISYDLYDPGAPDLSAASSK